MTGRGRDGTTLVELLVALVLASLLALAALQALRTSLLAAERTERDRQARAVARGGLSLVEHDLAGVTTGTGGAAAVESASATAVTIRTPIAMGLLCSSTGSAAVVSLAPVDSVTYATAIVAGAAYRQPDGQWLALPGATVSGVGSSSACTAANVGVTTLPAGIGATSAPAGRVITLNAAIPAATPPGTLVQLYRRLTYEFAASTQVAGSRALWRRVLGATGSSPVQIQEVAGPFDSTASLRYFTGTNRTADLTVPASLASIRGIELLLPGQSTRTGRTGAPRRTAMVRASVFFLNRTD